MTKLRTILTAIFVVAMASTGLMGVTTSADAAAGTHHAVAQKAKSKPKITITPSKNVKYGSKVTVKGTGFPNGPIFVVQCQKLVDTTCNTGALSQTKAVSGKFSVKLKVTKKWSQNNRSIIVATTASPSTSSTGHKPITFKH